MSKYNIRQIFADMELDLIKSMKRNLARHEAEEEKHGFKWTQWQARKLAALKAYRERNKSIVEQQAPNIEAEIDRNIRGSFMRGARKVADFADRLWNRFGFGKREDIKRPVPGTDDDSNFFKVNERRIGGLVKASQGELGAAQHAMLRKMDDVYRQTIFKAQVYMNSGAGSLGKAIDMATKDFLDKGIDCITYSNGRKINVASYAEMALRTASQRAVFAGEGARRDEIGVRTVVISAHNNCSPLCLPWQGKVYIDDVYSGGSAKDGAYPLLSKAMAGGLFHPSCRHNMATFFPGRSRLPEPVDDEVALGNYNAEQKQRYMERQVRRYKRREAGSVDPTNQAAAAAKVKEWDSKLKMHLVENEHLRLDRSRVKVAGELTTAQRKEVLKKAIDNAKIEEIRKHIRSDQQPKNIHIGQQGKHIRGHNNNTPDKSYLTISPEEAQVLVDRYASKGIINMTKNGEWKNTELIVSDTVVGKAIDPLTKQEYETNVFKVHYGKKGVHIVPTRKE